MESYRSSWPLRALVVAGIVYLLAPVILVVPLSFSADAVMVFPPRSWGVRWYLELFNNAHMAAAFQASVVLGVVVTVLSLAISVPAAYALVRLKPRGSELILNISTAPLLLPTIVLGLAMLMLFAPWRLLATWPGLVLAHLVVTVPYALRILITALETLPRDVEDAASTLGAHPMRVFFQITLPLMAPGMVAASALSFLVSFDEVVISLFLTGPNLTTLPVAMFHYADQRPDPMVACISALLIVITLAVVAVIGRTAGLARTFIK